MTSTVESADFTISIMKYVVASCGKGGGEFGCCLAQVKISSSITAVVVAGLVERRF